MGEHDHIRRVLDEIEAFWHTHPEMRLGQIVVKASNQPHHAAYFIGDGDLVLGVVDLARES